MMRVGPLTAVSVSLSIGVLASPFAALYCKADDPATMACCKQDMSECNRTGKTEDCCRTGPASEETVATVVKTQGPESRSRGPLLHPVALPAALALLGPAGAAFVCSSSPSPPHAPASTRTTVLRI